jgi:hypothetical protein
MNRKVIEDIVFGKQRCAVADLVIDVLESARQDMLPFMTTWEFFQHIVIVRKMYEMHERDRECTATDLSRLTTIPYPMVQQKLQDLLERGAVERVGPRSYVLAPEFFNSDFMLRGFRLRRVTISIAPEKMGETTEEN